MGRYYIYVFRYVHIHKMKSNSPIQILFLEYEIEQLNYNINRIVKQAGIILRIKLGYIIRGVNRLSLMYSNVVPIAAIGAGLPHYKRFYQRILNLRSHILRQMFLRLSQINNDKVIFSVKGFWNKTCSMINRGAFILHIWRLCNQKDGAKLWVRLIYNCVLGRLSM